jgi:hypothetical protein
MESLAAFALLGAIGHPSSPLQYRTGIVHFPPFNDRRRKSPQLCCDNHHDIRRWTDVTWRNSSDFLVGHRDEPAIKKPYQKHKEIANGARWRSLHGSKENRIGIALAGRASWRAALMAGLGGSLASRVRVISRRRR